MKAKERRLADRKNPRRVAAPIRPTPKNTGTAEEYRHDSDVGIIYDDLLSARDRLAGLAPLTSQDFERAARAMHEVIWFLLTPPRSAPKTLPISADKAEQLLHAARDRDLDLYVTVVALVAAKLGNISTPSGLPKHLDELNDMLDTITFDHRLAKNATVELLRRLKSELDARIAYVKKHREKGIRFSEPPELYKNRKDKTERPDRFFRRIYAKHLPRGLTQADIRKADPAFYNVLHVWCVRNKKLISNLVPAARPRRR